MCSDNDMEEMKEAKWWVVYDTPKVNTKRGKAASFPVIQHKKTQPFVNAWRKLQFESECDIISEKQDIGKNEFLISFDHKYLEVTVSIFLHFLAMILNQFKCANIQLQK